MIQHALQTAQDSAACIAANGVKTTGRFPGSRDSAFVDRCGAFFVRQLEAQQPSVILALGGWVPRFLAPLSAQLVDWQSCRSLQALDREVPVRHDVAFRSAAIPPCSVVCLTHPSLRPPNVERRRYAGLKGAAAERAMVSEATQHSGLLAHVV